MTTTAPTTRTVEHEISILAPAAEVFRLIVEVENWPQLFPPSVHVQRIETEGTTERIRIWATANGEAKTWASRRVVDPDGLRIEFRQEVSTPPVAAMGGCWIVERISDAQCLVRLRHDYRAVDDDPANVAWIEQAVDRNSRSELAALKANVELVTAGDRVLSFSDTVHIDGDRTDVYDFLNEASEWTDRLPHVARVRLEEPTPGLQVLEMDTRTKDGSTHTTKSVRVCFAPDRIVYKQTVVPALMTLHTGYWLLEDSGSGVDATSQHTVVINTENITAVLGPDADLEQARQYVRAALSGNSSATLALAKAFAEGRR